VNDLSALMAQTIIYLLIDLPTACCIPGISYY